MKSESKISDLYNFLSTDVKFFQNQLHYFDFINRFSPYFFADSEKIIQKKPLFL